ncbi:MAG: hypothetical protein Q6373_006410 [Candidatus Sigynarchaeota archaeon]
MGKVDGVLDNVVKANITGTNIYYYNNTFGPSIRTRDTFVSPMTNSTTFSLSGTNLSTSLLLVSYLNRLNGNLSALIPNIAAASGLIVSSFTPWKNIIAKEWFGINATYGGMAINQGNLMRVQYRVKQCIRDARCIAALAGDMQRAGLEEQGHQARSALQHRPPRDACRCSGDPQRHQAARGRLDHQSGFQAAS